MDHGPDANHYTIAIVSEGYQQAELGQFAESVLDFVGLFFATPPFSTNSSAFNFYRIDVASTDSGADDPALCADGSFGSGRMARTYFDATFCTGGSRRALVVDDASVIRVGNAQVPGWDALLVLVNTFEYGGTGGQVGVSSLSGTGTLIHELGHSAFGLADEYEYYLGCGVDPVGTQNFSPPFEPVAANITVQTDPNRVKWRALFYPGIRIPTTLNRDCTQCDFQPDPFPGQQRVGLYEGAGYYHCFAYRPAFDCKMRVLEAGFCPVCIRRIMLVLEPYVPSNSPPFANAGGPYVAECQGAAALVRLIGSDSSDPERGPLTYAWTTDCPGGRFDDATSATPVLTVISSPSRPMTCQVTLTVTDTAGATDAIASVVYIPQGLECARAAVGDLNDNGCVDRADLAFLLTQVRARSSDPRYDLNGDGKVDIADARFLALIFTNPDGSPCPP